MKYLIILSLILMCGCSTSARRTFLGNWTEAPETKLHVKDQGNILGYFTIKQHQKYWADELDAADMELMFTNTSNSILSFNFQINFQLRTPTQKYHRLGEKVRRGLRYNGYWTYTNAVVRIQPNSSVAFGMISNRIVSIKDGSIYVRLTSPVTYEE